MSFYTFSNRRLLFQEATERHATIAEMVDNTKNMKSQEKIDTLNDLEEIWTTLIQTIKKDDKEILSDGIDWTMPKEYIPIMHLGDCIPAVFATKCIIEQFAKDGTDRTDDLAIRTSLKPAWELFEQRRLSANNIEEGFGCDQSASWLTLRDIADQEGSSVLNKEMEEIAKLAGRMFRSFKYTKTKVESDDPQSIKSTTIGGDIERLLPSEMAKLSNEDTKDITSMKVLKKEANQFKMKGQRTKTRGPLVLALDESGSMHDDRAGFRGRNCWAKACAVALTRIAWSENRPVRVVHFAHSTVTQIVPKDDLNAMFEMARAFLSGGTSFYQALDASYKQVGDLEKAGFKGADIVFVTDGYENDYSAQNSMIDKLDKDGIKLWTVTVAGEMSTDSPMRDRAEKYINVRDDNLGSGLESGIDSGLLEGLQESAMAKPEPDSGIN